MQEIKNLYNWLFHYNNHTEEWTAFHREDYRSYWNGGESKYRMYKNASFTDVISQLHQFELNKK
jgi:hypothetical protein